VITGRGSDSLLRRLMESLLVLLAVAMVARLVWQLLLPLLPVLGGLLVLVSIGSWAVSRRRW
jgi:hypothetical protein